MSFNIKVGNVFDIEHGHIMHGCNAQGVMGSGVARIVRDDYPVAYEAYLNQQPNYILGEVIPAIVDTNKTIINAITQEHYGTDKPQVDYDAVQQACRGAKHLAASGIIASRDIHFPFIGAGLAGGDEHTLLTIFDNEFSNTQDSANPENLDGTLWLLPDHWMAPIILQQNQ